MKTEQADAVNLVYSDKTLHYCPQAPLCFVPLEDYQNYEVDGDKIISLPILMLINSWDFWIYPVNFQIFSKGISRSMDLS